MIRAVFSLTLAVSLCAPQAVAVSIGTVPVENPHNDVNSDGYGGVSYVYRIATTEVTNSQYVEFLNSVAASDTFSLYDTDMGSSTLGGIIRNGLPGHYSYAVKADAIGKGPGGSNYNYSNKPVVDVSWFDALRLANWLHNGQRSGPQNQTTTEDGAYTFSGATIVGARHSDAKWFLPSENEWYKAAYYDGNSGLYFNYPTKSNVAPSSSSND